MIFSKSTGQINYVPKFIIIPYTKTKLLIYNKYVPKIEGLENMA